MVAVFVALRAREGEVLDAVQKQLRRATKMRHGDVFPIAGDCLRQRLGRVDATLALRRRTQRRPVALTGHATARWVTLRDERGHKNARRRATCGDGNWGGLQPFPWAAEAAGAAIRTAPGHVMNAMPPPR